VPEDNETRANIQPPSRIWKPFPDLDWLAGGISLKADGPMSWSGFDPSAIIGNRFLYLAAQGLDPRRAISAEQVHERRTYVAVKKDAGRGIDSSSTRILATDALMTHEAGLILTTLHADCAPIYFADSEHKAIAMAHAGWRGTLMHLPREVVYKMSSEFGTVPQKLKIAVGPTISGEHYPVGVEVAEKLAREFGEETIVRAPDGTVQLDLFTAIIRDLTAAGVPSAIMLPRPPCTYSNPEYASFRRDGAPASSMMAWLTIRS
jgi:polyphenol oxidase